MKLNLQGPARLTPEKMAAIDPLINHAGGQVGDLSAALSHLMETHELSAALDALYGALLDIPQDTIRWMLSAALAQHRLAHDAATMYAAKVAARDALLRRAFEGGDDAWAVINRDQSWSRWEREADDWRDDSEEQILARARTERYARRAGRDG